MIKIKRLINRNFQGYAISLNLSKKHNPYVCIDGSRQTWISKKDALKMVSEIVEIFMRN